MHHEHPPPHGPSLVERCYLLPHVMHRIPYVCAFVRPFVRAVVGVAVHSMSLRARFVALLLLWLFLCPVPLALFAFLLRCRLLLCTCSPANPSVCTAPCTTALGTAAVPPCIASSAVVAAPCVAVAGPLRLPRGAPRRGRCAPYACSRLPGPLHLGCMSHVT